MELLVPAPLAEPPVEDAPAQAPPPRVDPLAFPEWRPLLVIDASRPCAPALEAVEPVAPVWAWPPPLREAPEVVWPIDPVVVDPEVVDPVVVDPAPVELVD